MLKKAEILRNRFETYLAKDSSRGLYFPKEFYDVSLKAVLIQEIFEPDITQKYLFCGPAIGSENSDELFAFGEWGRDEKRHLVFLCHGYNGHFEDLKFLKTQIMENDPSAKVYSWLQFKYVFIQEQYNENIEKMVKKPLQH